MLLKSMAIPTSLSLFSTVPYLKEQGGGWCSQISECRDRSSSRLGSSHLMGSQTTFSGILDSNCTFNPDFCNWHKVFIYYCDGSSFMSNIEQIDPKINLTFRGARIFNVMMDEMLAKGMRNAQNAILTGTSAGGLATILHCDKFRKLFSDAIRVKCISDSGFFMHGEGHHGYENRENFFANVIKTHKLANSLSPACTSKRNSSLCFFPEYLVEDIQTPLFMLESAFDRFQLTSLVLGITNCTTYLTRCNSTELGIMRDFRSTFIKTLEQRVHNSSNRGMFVHSCYLHDHVLKSDEWTCLAIANRTMRQAVADWYFDRSSFREIDTKNDSPRNCTNKFCQ
ncbi:pectin acetylesterase 7-like isoform X2 [Salvia miltiorrhiza]|uniref:pectin acetylesterase 7-like isoform X2 n=2 Tax=Salvia miltiorrhiza TaxID=226208 RepID=UPI0025AD73CE|nr:pectin acetylesterase 7-like isoform X2 [Salvia miltiorrhiza]